MYSLADATMMENVPFCILDNSPAAIEEKVRAAVVAIIGPETLWQIVHVWASPDCSTFSKMNWINGQKGNGYRDKKGKPLKGTEKGETAALHDLMVEFIITMYKHVH